MIDPASIILEVEEISIIVGKDKKGTNNEVFCKTFEKIDILVLKA